MRFVTYDLVTGRIDAVRSASGCRTAADILAVAYGPDADLWGAIPYDGSDLSGRMVDPSGVLVPDPAYTPPPPPVPETPTDQPA